VNLAGILDGHPEDAVAVVSRGQPMTYGELRARVGAVAGGLVESGAGPGDRVALLAANNLLFVASYFGALAAGCVAVPLNPLSPPRELARELASIDARVLVAGPAAAAAVAGIDRTEVPALIDVVAPRGAGIESATPFEDWLEADTLPTAARLPGDPAVLIFTAGTAGPPKAAVLSHGNLRSNLEQVQEVPGRALTDTDISLGVLPLFHIYGLNVVLGLTLFVGGRVVLAERFDPATALETIRNHGVTAIAGAPPMWHAWSTLPGAPDDSFATVRIAASGAAPLARDVAAAMKTRFGVEVGEGYGLTEASPVVTTSVPGGARLGSVGRALPGIEIRLVDEDGEDALVGDPGEVWVRGPNVFTGYWHDDAATRAALTPEGWLRTGDIAVTDDDGYLYLVDRAKDLIIVSGFNVYPAEVEEVLLEHPGVAQVAVVGVGHPHTGEAVKAFVVPTPGWELEEDSLVEHCCARLARYKCPTKVMFVGELPHGLAGKVLRRTLR